MQKQTNKKKNSLIVFELVTELLLQILKHHKSFMLNEEGLRNFSTTLENSMDTRHEVLRKLSRCSRIGALAKLEQKVKDLSVVTFNHKVSLRAKLSLKQSVCVMLAF